MNIPIDWILIAMPIELIALAALHRKTHRGPSTPALFVNLAAGAALLMALRSALTEAGAIAIQGWLLMALIAHVFDVRTRWSASERRSF